jgi:putative mRNA 3-end processing factor
MKITMHGAGREVGRSCIEVQWHDRRILLDCGLKINPDQNEYPTPIDKPEGIDAIFLSHAHLDHSGALPLVHHEGVNCPIFCTEVTKELTQLMLKDSWKIDRIEGRSMIYAKSSIREVLNSMQLSQSGVYKGIQYRLIPAGHIPGAVSVHLTYKGESLLYTGDISGAQTRLIHKHKPYPEVDVLITESTYGNRAHPDRSTVEKRFAEIVNQTIGRGGSVLVAVFAIARSQEMMLLLDQIAPNCPIYLDGMSKATTKIFLRHQETLRNRNLVKAVDRIDMVTSWESRKTITKKQGVFLATSGMLDGGPIVSYLKSLGQNKNNALILTGYQAEETNGRRLLSHGYVFLDGKPMDVTCPVYHLDFSAHADETILHDIINKTKPKFVITQHGETGSVKSLAAYAEAKGCKAFSPSTGETIIIDDVI